MGSHPNTILITLYHLMELAHYALTRPTHISQVTQGAWLVFISLQDSTPPNRVR